MPKSIEARYGSKVITIDQALALRGSSPSSGLQFFCVQCGKPVRPHKEGGGAAGHFEHLARNRQCTLSHVWNA